MKCLKSLYVALILSCFLSSIVFIPAYAKETGSPKGWEWNTQEGFWTYRQSNGILAKGWQNIDNRWYFFKADTSLTHSGWYLIDDEWYYFDSDGKMVTGWLEYKGDRYYLNEDGAMLKNICFIVNGEVYEADNSGRVSRLSSTGNAISTLSISEQTIPTNLYKGEMFGLRGIVRSDYIILNVTAEIRNSTGEYSVQTVSVRPNSKTYSLYGEINDSLIFDDLQEGKYLYIVTARDSSGAETVLINEEFSVLSNDMVNVNDNITKPYVADEASKNYSGSYSNYIVVNGFFASDTLMQHNSVTCTAYCDLLVGKITGQVSRSIKFEDIHDSLWGAGGAQWVYTEPVINGSKNWSADRKMREICLRILEGTPVIVRCGRHSVVAVGINSYVDVNSITTSDILIADSAKGKVMTLKELESIGYSIYTPDSRWSLIIPNGANSIPLSAY